jgi:hypothetical protein
MEHLGGLKIAASARLQCGRRMPSSPPRSVRCICDEDVMWSVFDLSLDVFGAACVVVAVVQGRSRGDQDGQ